jgi:hypothetical protein
MMNKIVILLFVSAISFEFQAVAAGPQTAPSCLEDKSKCFFDAIYGASSFINAQLDSAENFANATQAPTGNQEVDQPLDLTVPLNALGSIEYEMRFLRCVYRAGKDVKTNYIAPSLVQIRQSYRSGTVAKDATSWACSKTVDAWNYVSSIEYVENLRHFCRTSQLVGDRECNETINADSVVATSAAGGTVTLVALFASPALIKLPFKATWSIATALTGALISTAKIGIQVAVWKFKNIAWLSQAQHFFR